jgi:antitoxin HigA-1
MDGGVGPLMSISPTTTEPGGVGPMKNPPHPGEIVREEVIRPLGLSVTAAAAALGVTRQALSAFLNERSDLSPEMALRIEVAFGPKADVMMGVQTDYQMARARARLPEIEASVRRVKARAS